MNEKRSSTDGDRTLNPDLRPRTDETHDTTRSSPAPADSASVQHEEGRVWPLAWGAVVVAGIVFAVWILFF